MRSGACIVITALCCLLVIATSASAEGAWVLWERTSMTSPKVNDSAPWSIKSAHERKVACDEALAKDMGYWIGQWAKDGYKVVGPGEKGGPAPFVRFGDRNVWVVTPADMWVLTRTYDCLPDTVDMRGPNGK